MPQPAPEPTPEELLLTAIFGKSQKFEGAGQLVHFAHVEMASEPTLGEVIDFLNDFRGAYGAVDSFLSASVPNTYDPSVRLAERWFQESLSPPRDLVLYRAGFKSPGFWELLGNLNPLKVICDYLQQRHERRKDNEYRNRAEEQRLALENALLANEVVKQRVEILKSAGVSDEEVRAILTKHVAEPLENLGRAVDQRLVGDAWTDSEHRKSA